MFAPRLREQSERRPLHKLVRGAQKTKIAAAARAKLASTHVRAVVQLAFIRKTRQTTCAFCSRSSECTTTAARCERKLAIIGSQQTSARVIDLLEARVHFVKSSCTRAIERRQATRSPSRLVASRRRLERGGRRFSARILSVCRRQLTWYAFYCLLAIESSLKMLTLDDNHNTNDRTL